MKCTFCGAEIAENSVFCAGCGQPVQTMAQPNGPSLAPKNVAAEYVLSALRDPLFLVIAILVTTSCALTVLSGSGIPVIQLLAAIFLWLVYSQQKNQTFDGSHMRKVSGVVYAQYVLNYILAAALIICGGAFIPASVLLHESYDIIGEFVDSADLAILEELTETLGLSLSLILMIVGIVLLLVGVLVIVFNAVGYRRIHRFVKSVYQSVDYGCVGFMHCHAAQVWLVVFGVCSLISILTSDVNLLSIGCTLAQGIAMVLGSVIVRRYFVPLERQE